MSIGFTAGRQAGAPFLFVNAGCDVRRRPSASDVPWQDKPATPHRSQSGRRYRRSAAPMRRPTLQDGL